MVVSWTPLTYSEARGLISHYTVAYSPVIDEQVPTILNKTVLGMEAKTAKIEGLAPNTDYIVQVSVSNGAGRNELSPPVLAFINGKCFYSLCKCGQPEEESSVYSRSSYRC